jgi:hypothetical protein
MLFGASSGHFGERHSIFSSGSSSNDAPLGKKTFVSPVAESKGAAASGPASREFTDKEDSPLVFNGSPLKSSSSMSDDKKRDAKNVKDNKDDGDEDSWDIPAFLRRRKK